MDLEEFNRLKAARVFFAIVVANKALAYFDCLDLGEPKEAVEMKLDALKELLQCYRGAKKDYEDWIRNAK